MRISEVFHSIQGEGVLAGVPSVFVRTSGCNLRCSWCDTPYASWHPEGEDLEVAEIVARVCAFRPTKHVVLTGGEPMIARGIHELAARLREQGRHVTVETAGTVDPGGIACDLASISPKLANSTPPSAVAGAWSERHEAQRWQPDVVRRWTRHAAFQLKFVVGRESDLDEVESMLRALGDGIARSSVLLMPEGTDPAELAARGPEVAAWCLARGFRFCPRLHVALYGNRRGT